MIKKFEININTFKQKSKKNQEQTNNGCTYN
jgi:hypothetical protein